MVGKALLILSGETPPRECLSERPALVVAVDGGGDVCAAWDVKPNVVVGDMDSIRPETLARFEREGVRIVRHPRDKLHTDGQLAVDLALAEGAREIVLAGATGRRLDLTFVSLELILRAVRGGARVRGYEASGRLWTVTPRAPFEAVLKRGTVLSVLALTPTVSGLTERGVRFPLAHAKLDFGDPYCVSNEAAGGPVLVEIAAGIALVVLPTP